MKISNLINKIKGIALESNDHEGDYDAVAIVKNEDGTYMEVTSDDHNQERF